LFFICCGTPIIFGFSEKKTPPAPGLDLAKGKTVFYEMIRERCPGLPIVPQEKGDLARAKDKLPGLYEHLANFYVWSEDWAGKTAVDLAKTMATELLIAVRDMKIREAESPLRAALVSAGYYARKGDPQLIRKFLRPMARDVKFSWAFGEIEAGKAHELTSGRGVRLAIVDSGVDLTIKEIHAQIVRSRDLLGGKSSLGDNGHFPYDWGGHGTAVATVVCRVAPEVSLLIVKVNDDEGMEKVPVTQLKVRLFTAGIRWAAENGADVINLSAAYPEDPDGIIERAVRECWEKNIVVVAAMGNVTEAGRGRAPSVPAIYPWTIATGGVEKKNGRLRIWQHSSRGNYLSVVAPSAGIWVEPPVYLGGRPYVFPAEGNSLATPAVAATAALALSAMDAETVGALRRLPGRLAAAVREILTRTASNEKLGFDFPNPFSGFGLINCAKAVKLARTYR
jgi:subtilisin family serine protease